MMPLDPTDITQLRVWLHSLARTPEAQRKIVVDLLQHANGDRMSEIDRRFCRAALDLLDEARIH